MIPSKKIQNIRDSSFIAVCLSATSLSHSSEKGKKLLEYDSKEESFISFICLKIISCSYSEIKDVIQALLSFFGLATATSFNFLR